MITSSHEAMNRFFRDLSAGLTDVLRGLGVFGFPEFTSVAALPEGLTAIEPVERRVDTAMMFTTTPGNRFIVVFEVHGGNSREAIEARRRDWPYQLVSLQGKYGCPVVLVVVCQDPRMTMWAAEPISLGPRCWPTFVVNPLVIGPENIRLPSGPIAREQLSVAALSVLAHGKRAEVGPVLDHVANALKNADESTRAHYAQVIWWALSPQPTASRWMELMKTMNLDEELLASLSADEVFA